MSYHLLKLRRAKKKFDSFGTEKADLKKVITLLTETFIADDFNGSEKIQAFNDLLAAANGLVENREALLVEKNHIDLDEEDKAIINEHEQKLNDDLYLFCQTFNEICATAGVVEYFAADNGETIWTEISEYFQK